MTKQQSIEKWQKEVFSMALKNAEKMLTDYLQSHAEQIIKQVCQNLCNIFENISRKQQYKAAYITFHLMRKDILDGIYQYRVFLYNDSWYLKPGQQIDVLDTRFVYDYYELFYKDLIQNSIAFRSFLSVAEIEIFAMRALETFHGYVVDILRYAINDVLEQDCYYKIQKEQVLEIQSGEYYESCDKIYKEVQEIDYGKWRREFKKGENKLFLFEDLRGIELTNISAMGTDCRYTNFQKSDLKGTSFQNAILIGTRFQHSNMKYANFEATLLNYARFDDADLEGACFEKSITMFDTLFDMIEMKKAFCAVSFVKSCLKNANFKSAYFQYADFRGADLTDADFTGALLENCIFSEEPNLTEEQKKHIIIKK